MRIYDVVVCSSDLLGTQSIRWTISLSEFTFFPELAKPNFRYEIVNTESPTIKCGIAHETTLHIKRTKC
jgi:hypothetical protein